MKTIPLRALTIQILSICAIASASEDTNIIAEVTGRFHPSKPAVLMNYDVTYTLLHIRLKRVASGTIKSVEGTWLGSTGKETPACLIDFTVASPRKTSGNDNNGINLFKRTVSVLTMPNLELITYAKENDEFIKPLFRKGSRMKYIEVYNFEAGAFSYLHHDLVTDAVETNLPGMADLARQSTEMADVLQTLHGAYHGQPSARPAVSKVHFNVEGAVRTFALKMKKGIISVPVLSRKIMALHGDLRPGDESITRNESFSLWCMPFREFSEETSDPELKKLGATSLDCSMLPLSGEYCLFIGAIDCTLTNICIQPH